jgi:hypothetical protein
MDRKTVNFSSPPTWLKRYATPGTPEHAAMLHIVPEAEETLKSESAVLLALVEHARGEVEEEKLRMLYDQAYGGEEVEPEAAAAMAALEDDYAGYVQGDA